MRKFLFVLVALGLAGCQPSDTRGACRDFEVCTTYEDQSRECENVRIWFECDSEVEDRCEWRELDRDMYMSNDRAVPCEQCDHRQCPDDVVAETD